MIRKTICPLDCPDSCGILATVEGGKIISLKGDPEHPMTSGFICRKMMKYPERVYNQDRITTPLLRIGEKGEGQFKKISWSKAWEILTDKLKSVIDEYGGEAVMPYCYAGNMGQINRFAGFPLFNRMGATRIEQTICSASANAGWKAHFGSAPGSPPQKAADADLIVLWGINAKVSNVHFWKIVTQAKKKGCKVVVVDPYRNATASSADYYYPVKPGGDCGIALGALKYLLEQGDIDEQWLQEHTTGFEYLKNYLNTTDWTEFENQAGLSRDEICEFASLLRDNPKTFIRIGVGLTRNSRGGMITRSICCLGASLKLFAPGAGRGILGFTGAFKGGSEQLRHDSLLNEESRKINMIQLGKALTTLVPPIKCLIVYNSNPVSVAPDSSIVKQGLRREDLFTIVHEQVMSPTAKFADIVLPATTFLENRDIYTAYGHFYLGIVDKVIEPVGEAMSNFDFFQTLAKKLGYIDSAFSQTVDDRIKLYLQEIKGFSQDISHEKYMEGGYVGSTRDPENGSLFFQTKTGFRFYNPKIDSPHPFPQLIEGGEFEDPDFACRFPLKLITPPHIDLLNSTFGERYQGKSGELLIHPEDAASHDIVDGQSVSIVSCRGKCVRIAHISKKTQPGLVVAEGLFWPGNASENGVNDLTSQKLSDLSGGATFHESMVSISAMY